MLLNVRDENYRGKFLFTAEYFVPFSTDRQSIYFMPTRFLEYNINEVCVTQFQEDYNLVLWIFLLLQ